MSIRVLRGIVPLVGLLVSEAHAQTPLDTELDRIQQQWIVATYQLTSKGEKVKAFDALASEAHRLSTANPQRAEPLIWEGVVLITYAGAKGGLGALSLAKRSRAVLEASLKIDDKALDASAYTGLGLLYSKVPGSPLGFGSDGKAEELFAKALQLNPDGIDPNYFYAQYLCDRNECSDALRYLERAAEAPLRPGRELVDEERHREVMELMAKAQ